MYRRERTRVLDCVASRQRTSYIGAVALDVRVTAHWLLLVCIPELDACDADGQNAADSSHDAAITDAECATRCAPDETPQGCGCSRDGVRMRFGDPREEYYAEPWPLSTRVRADGGLDLTGIPLPATAGFLRDNLETLATHTLGFATNGALFVAFDGAIDPRSLPSDARASTAQGASVFLAEIDPASATRGERVPLLCRYRDDATDYNPEHFLACAPFPGFPLRPATLYGLYLTDGLLDAGGEPVRASQRWRDVLDGDPQDASDEALVEAFAPFADFARVEEIAVESLVGGTVFRTQDPIAPMRAIAEHVAALAAPAVEALAPYAGTLPADESGNYAALSGSYDAPIYQQGETPYGRSGGDIRFDADGAPIVATTMSLQVHFTLPTDVQMPADGWPVALYHHGTTGDASTFIRDGTAFYLAAAGVAGIGIDAPVHGLRRPADVDPTLLFFNIQNVLALRDNVRQGAADLLVLERVVEALDVSAADSPTGEGIRFDPARIFFMGHSQGALTGALYLGVSTRVRGAMLSGAGGSITMTVIHKRAPIDIPALARSVLVLSEDEALDAFHPALALVQAFTEPVDSTNFAPYAYRWEGGRGFDLWLTQGMLDREVPLPVTAALATAYGVSPVAPEHEPLEGLSLRELPAATAPVSDNTVAHDGTRFTGVYTQHADQDHYLITRDPASEARLEHWFRTLAENGKAELAAP